MKITELEYLKEGDFLMVKPIPELCSALIDFTRIRVRFDGFDESGKLTILFRGKVKKIETAKIDVIGRYTIHPHHENGSRH